MQSQRQLYKAFQKTNPEKFNQDLIYMREKESHDLHSYFDDLFKSLKLPGIKYLSSKTITNEAEFVEFLPNEFRAIEENRLDLISAKFELSHGDESKEYDLNIFFPKLIDDFFFQLAGNRYCAVYQLTDRNFYPVSNGVSLKTLLMPLTLRTSKFEFTTMDGEVISCNDFTLDFFNSKAKNADIRNMFTFFIIKFGGVQKALDFLFENDKMEELTGCKNVYLTDNLLNIDESIYTVVGLKGGGKPLYLVYREPSKSHPNKQAFFNLLGTIIKLLAGVRKTLETIDDEAFWKRKILRNATTKLAKADQTMKALERVYDTRTQKNLREVEESERESVYHLIRWMVMNFDALTTIDSVDVYNRRIRLYEYMLYPLLTKLSDASYRIFNSRTMDVKRLETVFSNIGPMFIVKRLMTNELFRYTNSTSTLDLFASGLRWSARGPQALGGGGENVATSMRSVHPSYMGVIGLTNASASQPGLTGTFCPMTDMIDGMFFEEPGREAKDIYYQGVEEGFFDETKEILLASLSEHDSISEESHHLLEAGHH